MLASGGVPRPGAGQCGCDGGIKSFPTQAIGLKQHSHHGENLLAITNSVLPATALDIDYFLRGFR